MKAKITIFVFPGKEITKRLTDHIGKHIDALNKKLIIDIVMINQSNISRIKELGIKTAPTLVYGNNFYTDFNTIIHMLTPKAEVENNPDFLGDYQSRILDSGDNTDDSELVEDEIRKRMMTFQKRRTVMKGVERGQHIDGGRKLKDAKPARQKFNNDSEFHTTSGKEEEDIGDYNGSLLLEEYYNQEADRCGRKPNMKQTRWSK